MTEPIASRSSSTIRWVEKSDTASTNEQWQSFCSEIKRTMTGSEQEKDDVLRRRLMKFFHSFSLEKNHYYVERRELIISPSTHVQISNNAILLYGIDFLSEGKIQRYFQPFDVTVEYYDDSHCSVCFDSYENLMKSVYIHMQKTSAMLEDFPTFYAKMGANNLERLTWRPLESYYEMCFERALWFRFLTSNDFQNKGQMGQTAMHQSFLIAKDKFFKEIQKTIEDNSRQQKKAGGRQRSRDFSRSGSRENRNERSRSRSRERRRDTSNYGCREQERCSCHCLSRQLKRFIQYSESRDCRLHSSQNQRQKYEKYEQKPYKNDKKPVSRQFQSYNQPNNHQKPHRKPFVHPALGNPPKNSNQHKNRNQSSSVNQVNQSKRSSSRIIDENINQNDDTITSLVNELEKYKFEEEEENFEQHIIKQENEKPIFRAESHQLGMDEETVFEIIQEQ